MLENKNMNFSVLMETRENFLGAGDILTIEENYVSNKKTRHNTQTKYL